MLSGVGGSRRRARVLAVVEVLAILAASSSSDTSGKQRSSKITVHLFCGGYILGQSSMQCESFIG